MKKLFLIMLCLTGIMMSAQAQTNSADQKAEPVTAADYQGSDKPMPVSGQAFVKGTIRVEGKLSAQNITISPTGLMVNSGNVETESFQNNGKAILAEDATLIVAKPSGNKPEEPQP
jgi:cytoskeletal protein CcmA (bactofilin family)